MNQYFFIQNYDTLLHFAKLIISPRWIDPYKSMNDVNFLVPCVLPLCNNSHEIVSSVGETTNLPQRTKPHSQKLQLIYREQSECITNLKSEWYFSMILKLYLSETVGISYFLFQLNFIGRGNLNLETIRPI